uniref:Uncharacterized protein n=1 Tax=Anguilla anguilla TaxID=7936 RepID=A0A0E9T053_ANGAN
MGAEEETGEAVVIKNIVQAQTQTKNLVICH